MPTPYRYTSPVSRKSATGLVAAVYEQIAADFILADGPLMSLSPVPELLAAAWSLLRESQVAGLAPRVDAEAVAAAVSAANHCRFCVDAHTALVHAAGDHALAEAIWRGQTPADPNRAALVAWAAATARRDAVGRIAPPVLADQAAEYIAVALVTHFLNRMVSSLLNENVLPGRLGELALVRRVAGGALGRAVRRRPPAGESLPLLGAVAARRPAWAGETPVATAYAALAAAAATGASLLGRPARDLIDSVLADWDGSPSLLGTRRPAELLATLPPRDRSGVRIALLTALAPYDIADADIAAWRAHEPGDASLIRLGAFGAMAAVERIEHWTVAAFPAAALRSGAVT